MTIEDVLETADLQYTARQELEGLSAEIEAAGDRTQHIFTEQTAQALEEATATLAEASDALETVRAARSSLHGNDPAIVRPKGKGKKGKGKGGKGKGRGKGARPSVSIAERKANSSCKTCGGWGHWSGDPECPGSSSGATRSANVADLGEEGDELYL